MPTPAGPDARAAGPAAPDAPAAVVGVRERLVAAAAELTCESGWAALTMGKVAARAGLSRQTLYNELGSKPELGQAMVLRELERFLDIVGTELDAHTDLVQAIRSAAEKTLLMARDNPLLHAVLASAHSVSRGNDPAPSNELLPFLTTDAQPLIEAATRVIAERIPERFPEVDLDAHERDVAIDAIVRLVLSHVMQPDANPAATADDLAWIVARVLRQG
ncbi:TetR family transcriptional regulator [Nocardioides mesophilus]|uniref:TetR/AcrR family transcriptional regulator n=1 Tax=Nocardioides mesophilus TaxID=433659 RepID=A0A7G9RFV9_9ACTN|nr:TetR family transcriptional regulator [Nocardioides mesophilus]QNN54484.1 TetR/AcrR family transcriptional regulator [Nocardioides mesophilus]